MTGRLVLLNGLSSAGKSTLAQAFVPADLAAQLRDAVDDWPTTTAFERLAAAG